MKNPGSQQILLCDIQINILPTMCRFPATQNVSDLDRAGVNYNFWIPILVPTEKFNSNSGPYWKVQFHSGPYWKV